jgi:hypothetical protein
MGLEDGAHAPASDALEDAVLPDVLDLAHARTVTQVNATERLTMLVGPTPESGAARSPLLGAATSLRSASADVRDTVSHSPVRSCCTFCHVSGQRVNESEMEWKRPAGLDKVGVGP